MAPKQGPDSGPKNGATILKLAAQLPNVWSQFWAHGVRVLPSAKSALSCDRLHLPFMFSCAWCQDAGFTCRVRSEGRQKSMQAHSPKNGSASQRKPKETFQKGQGCQCCSAANMTATSNAKTCVPPAAVYRTLGATPGTPQISKLTYFRTLQSYTRKGSKTSFCEWQR